jgi:hypothetical protein
VSIPAPAALVVRKLLKGAGYLFVHFCHRYRFRAQWLDGYRLLLESATAGLILLAVARIITFSINYVFPSVSQAWNGIVPEHDFPYLGTAVGSMILGVAIPFIYNRLVPNALFAGIWRRLLLSRRMRPLRRVARRIRTTYHDNRDAPLHAEITLHGDGLTRLLHEAADAGKLISVTMESRKWYVGYVAEAVKLEPKESYFRILPVISGYRDKDTLKLNRLVYYTTSLFISDSWNAANTYLDLW